MKLKMHLFRTDGSREFVTSDEPLVLHNSYCEGIDHRGVCGWQSVGLQIILPLSPDMTLMLYDATTYRVGRRGEDSTGIRSADVRQFNVLQLLNCHSAVYFCSSFDPSDYPSRVLKSAAIRPKERFKFIRTEPVDEGGGESSELVHFFEPLLDIEMNLPAVQLRRSRRRISLHQRASMLHGRVQEPTPGGDVQTYRARPVTTRER